MPLILKLLLFLGFGSLDPLGFVQVTVRQYVENPFLT